MDKKINLGFFLLIALCFLYVLFTFLVFITRGKMRSLVKRKVVLGTLILSLSAMLSTGSIVFSQDAGTPVPTPTFAPTPMCYTSGPTQSPIPVITQTPTHKSTPICYTRTPSPTPTPTPMSQTMGPTQTPVPSPTPVITPTCYTPPPPTQTPVITKQPTNPPTAAPIRTPTRTHRRWW